MALGTVAPAAHADGEALEAYAYVTSSELCTLSFDAPRVDPETQLPVPPLYDPPGTQRFASSFVATSSGALDSVTIDTDATAPTVSISADAGNGTPGQVISTSGAERAPSTPPALLDPSDSTFRTEPPKFAWRTFDIADHGDGATLVAGRAYWIIVTTATDNEVSVGRCAAVGEPALLTSVNGAEWAPLASTDADVTTLYPFRIVGDIRLRATGQVMVGTVGSEIWSSTAFTEEWFDPTYRVVPDLPAGLSLDESNGVVSGIPSAVQPSSEFTVTGSGADTEGGVQRLRGSARLTVTVNGAVPRPPEPSTSADALDAGDVPIPTVVADLVVVAMPVATAGEGPVVLPDSLVIENPASVSAAEMSAWTPGQVASIEPLVFGLIPPAAIGALTPAQAGAMTPEQVASIRPLGAAELQPAAVRAMPERLLAAMRPASVGALTASAICAPIGVVCVLGADGLTAKQVAAFTPRSFARLSSEVFSVLRPGQVTMLTAAAIGQIRSAGAASLHPRTLAALQPRQLAGLRVSAVRALTPRALELLSRRQLAALPDLRTPRSTAGASTS
ncbi:MAG: hypothetical protein QG597_2148 [Actinomycetota bacterium]|jgi:hypothetical protein|nr:hypothetical protein [Actinomycetota bacterium]